MEHKTIFLVIISLSLFSMFFVFAGDTSNIFIISENPQDLNDLRDVMITSPTNDDGIRFEDGNWVNVLIFDQNEVLDLISGSEFDYFLVGDASDIPDYNKLIDFDSGNPGESINKVIVADGTLIASFATEPGEPDFSTLSSGVYEIHLHALIENAPGTKDSRLFFQLFEREPTDGNETLLMTSHPSQLLTDTESAFETHAVLSEEESIDGNRLVLKVFGNIDGSGSNPDVNVIIEGDTLARLVLRVPISTFDTRYLKLNATNDPVTGDLDIDANLQVAENLRVGSPDNYNDRNAVLDVELFTTGAITQPLLRVGTDSSVVSGIGGIGLGDSADCTGVQCIAIGQNAGAFDRCIAIGDNAECFNLFSVAIGQSPNARGNACVAIGQQADCESNHAVAIGDGNAAGAFSLSLLGGTTSSEGSISSGWYMDVAGDYSYGYCSGATAFATGGGTGIDCTSMIVPNQNSYVLMDVLGGVNTLTPNYEWDVNGNIHSDGNGMFDENVSAKNVIVSGALQSDDNQLCTDSVCYDINDLNNDTTGNGSTITDTNMGTAGRYDFDTNTFPNDENFLGNVNIDKNLTVDKNLYVGEDAFIIGSLDIGEHLAGGNLGTVVDRKVVNVAEIVNTQYTEFVGVSNFIRHDVPFETNKWVINMLFELKNNSTGTTFRDVGVLGYVKNIASGIITKAYAINGAVRNESTGTIINAVGNQGSIIQTGSGEITRAFGFTDFYNFTDGNIGTIYGYFADQLNMSGTADVGTHYQFYAAPQIDGDDANYNWGFYQDGKLGQNYFDANVGMGSNLDVNGDVDVNGNINSDTGFCINNNCITAWSEFADKDTVGFSQDAIDVIGGANPEYLDFQLVKITNILGADLGFMAGTDGNFSVLSLMVENIVAINDWIYSCGITVNGIPNDFNANFSAGDSFPDSNQVTATQTYPFSKGDIIGVQCSDIVGGISATASVSNIIADVEMVYD